MGYGDQAKATRDAEVRVPEKALPPTVSVPLRAYQRGLLDCELPNRRLFQCYREVAKLGPEGNCLAESQCYLSCSKARFSQVAQVRRECASQVAHGVLPDQVLNAFSYCMAAAATMSNDSSDAAAAACEHAAQSFLTCAAKVVTDRKTCPAPQRVASNEP